AREHWPELLEAFDESCRILGARAVGLKDLLDESAAESRVSDLHDRILPWVEQADLLLTHWHGDVNQVHRGVSRAVEIATRPFRRRRDVSCFEVLTSTDQGFGGTGLAFQPTEYVLLDASHAQRKCKAVAKYRSEITCGRTP